MLRAKKVFAFLSRGADTEANTWPEFEVQAAYESEVRLKLPLRPSAIAAPPSGPSWFVSRLQAPTVFAFLSRVVDKTANTI